MKLLDLRLNGEKLCYIAVSKSGNELKLGTERSLYISSLDVNSELM